jgi:signal transduction histidine kinase/ligand-binding sensor domain-containing protein/DNA-binding response OmpR family regulator
MDQLIKSILGLVITLSLIATSLFGQGTGHPYYKFAHFSSQDGLPQNSVLAITQDQLGFMWFGTDDGLAKYDGYSFQVFRNDPTDLQSLTNNVIRALAEDKNGFLWIGTEGGGLTVFDPYLEAFFTFNPNRTPFEPKKISSISIDEDGDIWVGTQTHGVYLLQLPHTPQHASIHAYFEEIEIHHFHRENSRLEDDKIWTVYPVPEQKVYIGTMENGAFELDKGSLSLKRLEGLPQSLEKTSIKTFLLDAEEGVWMGTEQQGAWIRKTGETLFEPFELPEISNPFQQSSKNITMMHKDFRGDLWIGTLGQGLYVKTQDSEEIIHYQHQPMDRYGLQGNSIYTFYQDEGNTIWIGMYSGEGLHRINPENQHFEHVQFEPLDGKGLSGKMVKAIHKDASGNLWVGLFNGGISMQPADTEAFTYFSASGPTGLSHNHVQRIAESKEGNLYFGTDGGGLNVYQPQIGRFKTFQHDPLDPNSLSKNEVWAIAIDQQGMVWLGTANGGGLNKFDPKTEKFQHIPHNPEDPDSPAFDDIRALFIDSKNNLWMGTFGGGVSKMNLQSGKYTHYRRDLDNPNSLSHDLITDIWEDRRGYVWVGTFGGGLNRFNPLEESFDSFRIADGLPSDVIKAIREDFSGQIWVSTVNGLSVMDEKLESFKNFSKEDGLQSDEFNLGSAFIDNNGKLYFGGANGFNAFLPEEISKEKPPKTPVVTRLRVLNQDVKPLSQIGGKEIIRQSIAHTPSITFAAVHNSFEFEFSALEFARKDRVLYAYKMEGVDEDWVGVTDGRRRFAPYANLRPGNYTFQVKSFFEEGQNSSQVRHLSILVLPPWYASGLAYFSYALLMLLLAYVIQSAVKKRIRLKNDLRFEKLKHQKDEEINQLKLRFFTNISHELRTPLMLIKAPLEQLLVNKELPESLHKQVRSIHKNTLRLLRLINQLLEFRKQETGNLKLQIEKVHLPQFLENIAQDFEGIANQKNIAFSCQIAGLSEEWAYVDPLQLEKVFYNLIFNAFKFTPENGKITIRCQTMNLEGEDASPNWFQVEVEDNGKGILEAHQPFVFERFFQVEQDRLQQEQIGTGIGLALCKNIVDLHQGQISLFSKPHEKTVFAVRLKMGHAHLPGSFSEQSPPTLTAKTSTFKDLETLLQPLSPAMPELVRVKSEKGKLLLVEDNEELLTLLKEAFENQYHILTARNGKEAVHTLNQQKPDFIISDVMMPEMDGITFCKIVKTNLETSHIPLILLTAKGSHAHQSEGYASGADDYITKPFPLDLLQLKVKNVLSGRSKLKNLLLNKQHINSDTVKIADMDGELIKKAISEIEKHLDDPKFTVNGLSKSLGISRTLLFEKFKALVRETPNDFIQSIRLKHAAHLLLHSKGMVAEIAYKVGFNEPKYFSKCFQRHYGQTPSAYRNQHKVLH